ncbi:MAG: YncE family protein [Candidatus Dormiibacterota bacterium]
MPAKQRIWDRRRLYPAAAGVVAGLFLFGAVAAHFAGLVSAASLPGYSVLVGDGQSGAVYLLSAGATTPTSIPAPVSAGVRDLVMSPDGSEVYVDFSNGAIGVIDTSSDAYVGSLIQLGAGVDPGPMVITPNGQDLYVAESGVGQVAEVDLLTGTVMAPTIETGAAANLAISPDGNSLYFDAGSQGSAVSVINTATNTVVDPSIPVAAPGALIPSADGSQLYVLSTPSSGPALAVIEVGANVRASSLIPLPTTAQFSGLAFAAGTSQLYLPDAEAEQLQTIDTTTGTVGAASGTLATGFIPEDIEISPDGTTAFVDGTAASGAAELLPVDLGAQVASSPILLGSGVQPAGMVLVPTSTLAAPTPSPTAPPTPVCSPIVGIGPAIVDPTLFPPAGTPSSVAGSAPDSEASSTPDNQHSPTPTSAASPEVTSFPPVSAPVPPATGPILCFGMEAVAPPGARAAAVLTSSPSASPTGGLLLPGALALLGITGVGAALFARRSRWTIQDLRTWTGR